MVPPSRISRWFRWAGNMRDVSMCHFTRFLTRVVGCEFLKISDHEHAFRYTVACCNVCTLKYFVSEHSDTSDYDLGILLRRSSLQYLSLFGDAGALSFRDLPLAPSVTTLVLGGCRCIQSPDVWCSIGKTFPNLECLEVWHGVFPDECVIHFPCLTHLIVNKRCMM